MASESRTLLDEQISSLNALRHAAESAYSKVAVLPAMARLGNQERLAFHLAQLVVESRARLRDCLDVAEHWLQPTKPVYVPVPIAEGEYPSACGGAYNLLVQVAVLAGIGARASESLPTNTDELSTSLTVEFRQDGIPSWILSAPVDELQHLANLVPKETDTAIARLTHEFRAAESSSIGPVLDALSALANNVTKPATRSSEQRGRKKADYETEQREAQLAAKWRRARESAVYKPNFAKEIGTSTKQLDKLLDRVAARNRRSNK